MARKRKTTPAYDVPRPRKVRKIPSDLPLASLPFVVGNVYVSGQGDMGQLGLGEDNMERKRPTIVPGINNIIDICAGGMHSLCLTSQGIVYSFGCNDEGALGRDSSKEGSEFEPAKVQLPAKCIKISAGDSHSAYLLEDGSVFACGTFRDSHGNMGLTLEGNQRLPVKIILDEDVKVCNIASGSDHLAILTCEGVVYTLGCGEQGQLGRVSLHTASGESRRGKSPLLTPGKINMKSKLIDAIWTTCYCTFLRENGTNNIYANGLNNYNQLCIKNISPVITPILTELENVSKIAGGQHHSIVLKENNEVYVIGRKAYGRLGLKEIDKDANELTILESLKQDKIIDINCGDCTSFAVTNIGVAYAWGMGSNHQLGTGNEDDEYKPVVVTGKQISKKNVVKISSGGQHTLYLIADYESSHSNNDINHQLTNDSSIEEGSSSRLQNGNKTIDTSKLNGNVISEKENIIDEKTKSRNGRKRNILKTNL